MVAVGEVVFQDVLGKPGDEEAQHVAGQGGIARDQAFAEGGELLLEMAMSVYVCGLFFPAMQGKQALLMAEMEPGIALEAGDHLGQYGGILAPGDGRGELVEVGEQYPVLGIDAGMPIESASLQGMASPRAARSASSSGEGADGELPESDRGWGVWWCAGAGEAAVMGHFRVGRGKPASVGMTGLDLPQACGCIQRSSRVQMAPSSTFTGNFTSGA